MTIEMRYRENSKLRRAVSAACIAEKTGFPVQAIVDHLTSKKPDVRIREAIERELVANGLPRREPHLAHARLQRKDAWEIRDQCITARELARITGRPLATIKKWYDTMRDPNDTISLTIEEQDRALGNQACFGAIVPALDGLE